MNFSPPHNRDAASYILVGEDRPQTRIGEELREVFCVLRDGWKIILRFVLGALLLAFIYVLLTPSLFSARTELLLDPRQKQVVSGEVMDTRLGSSPAGPDTLMLDSQVQVILSQSVMRRFVAEQGLATDPEFAEGESLVSGLIGKLTGAAPRPQGAAGIDERLLNEIREHVDVSREANTYVIGINFKSEDPAKAARLANGLAEAYLAQNINSLLNTNLETAEALEGRLETLRIAANRAGERVEEYRRENGLIGTQNLLVVEQTLSELNNQLSLARVASGEAEANLAKVQEVLSSRSRGARASAGGSLESEIITKLQIDLSALDVEEASLRARYLPRHPEIERVQQQKAALAASLDAEYERVARRTQVAFQVAKEQETTLATQVRELEAQAASSNSASVRLRELQREAEASQALYETYLKRAKEVSEQSGLPTETARVISEAFPPEKPSEPKTMLLLVSALVLGLGLGVFYVWLAHVVGWGRTRTAEPGQADADNRPAAPVASPVPAPMPAPLRYPAAVPAAAATPAAPAVSPGSVPVPIPAPAMAASVAPQATYVQSHPAGPAPVAANSAPQRPAEAPAAAPAEARKPAPRAWQAAARRTPGPRPA